MSDLADVVRAKLNAARLGELVIRLGKHRSLVEHTQGFAIPLGHLDDARDDQADALVFAVNSARALCDQLDHVEAERDQVAEQIAYLRTGAAHLGRDELIQRITAVGPAEWRAGHWLSLQIAPLEQERADLRDQVEQLTEELDQIRAQLAAAAGSSPVEVHRG